MANHRHYDYKQSVIGPIFLEADKMREKIDTPDVRRIYGKKIGIIEPVNSLYFFLDNISI